MLFRSKLTRAESVEIKWPSGQMQVFHDVPGDRFYVVRESQNALSIADYHSATHANGQGGRQE